MTLRVHFPVVHWTLFIGKVVSVAGLSMSISPGVLADGRYLICWVE